MLTLVSLSPSDGPSAAACRLAEPDEPAVATPTQRPLITAGGAR